MGSEVTTMMEEMSDAARLWPGVIKSPNGCAQPSTPEPHQASLSIATSLSELHQSSSQINKITNTAIPKAIPAPDSKLSAIPWLLSPARKVHAQSIYANLP